MAGVIWEALVPGRAVAGGARRVPAPGRAVQVQPMRHVLKASGSMLLKPIYIMDRFQSLLSNSTRATTPGSPAALVHLCLLPGQPNRGLRLRRGQQRRPVEGAGRRRRARGRGYTRARAIASCLPMHAEASLSRGRGRGQGRGRGHRLPVLAHSRGRRRGRGRGPGRI